MKQLLTILLCLLSATVFAQTNIGNGRAQVKRFCKSYLKYNHYTNSAIRETDTAIVMELREPTVKQADFIYYIDRKGKCYAEKLVGDCYECVAKRLNWVLSKERFGWIKLDSNKYVSKFSRSIQLEVIQISDTLVYLDIRRIFWGKPEYQAMVKNK